MPRPNMFPRDMSCPCFNCPRRTPTCKFEGNCKEYPAWKAEKDAKNEQILKAKKDEQGMNEITYRNYNKKLRIYQRKVQRGY